MKRRAQIAASLILAALLFAAVPMRSEGPLLVGGPSVVGLVQKESVPYAWTLNSLAFNSSTRTLSYWTDQGPLGSISNPDSFVAQALGAWAAVPTANIQFTLGGHLGADVTATNFMSVQTAVYDCTTVPGLPAGGIAKPVSIIFDSNGGIISSLGEDPRSLLGFAEGICPTSDGTNNTYNRGFALINGGSGVTLSELKTVMIHEFGHMLGLDHAQINLDCLNSTCDATSLSGVPIMFPVLIDDKQAPVVDDMAGLSALYPVTGSPPAGKTLLSSMGEIQGRIYFSDGVTQAQGFNVIARRVGDPRVTASSNLSGYLFTEEVTNGAIPSSSTFADPYFSQDQTLIGYFDIPGLPPGDYTVEVEAINDSGTFPFVLGSSVGPIGGYLGFQFPLPGSCSPQQFYVSPAGPYPCASSNATQVNVPAESTSGPVQVNISLIGTGPGLDAWED